MGLFVMPVGQVKIPGNMWGKVATFIAPSSEKRILGKTPCFPETSPLPVEAIIRVKPSLGARLPMKLSDKNILPINYRSVFCSWLLEPIDYLAYLAGKYVSQERNFFIRTSDPNAPLKQATINFSLNSILDPNPAKKTRLEIDLAESWETLKNNEGLDFSIYFRIKQFLPFQKTEKILPPPTAKFFAITRPISSYCWTDLLTPLTSFHLNGSPGLFFAELVVCTSPKREGRYSVHGRAVLPISLLFSDRERGWETTFLNGLNAAWSDHGSPPADSK